MSTRKILVSFIFLFVFVSSALCSESSMLVTQPAYHSMSFYVYKPSGISGEFYSTYDGYLVYQSEDGVWNYASSEKNGIVKTNYVVGSVIPSVVMLKPHNAEVSRVAPLLSGSSNVVVPGTKIFSSASSIRPAGTRIENPNQIIELEIPQEKIVIDLNPKNELNRAIYVPPTSGLEVYNPVVYKPNAIDWTRNSNFMAIGKWQKSIDRIGVLDRPAVPVAWKGDYPEVIYAWTGLQWRQISAKGKHVSALSTIRREVYSLTVQTNRLNILHWRDNDTRILAQYSMMWGYQWLGQILLERGY